MDDGKHDCPCGCEKRIGRHLLSCRSSWFALPEDIRQQVWAARKPGATISDLAEAIAAAKEFWRASGRLRG
jgi:hypothetical protein